MDRTCRADCVTCDKCKTTAPCVLGHLPGGWHCLYFANGNAYKPRILCGNCQRDVLDFIDHKEQG